jgi:hypothetical protein
VLDPNAGIDIGGGTNTLRRPAHEEWYGESLSVFLNGLAAFLGPSCGSSELPRRDADDPLELVGELALIREAGTGGDLRQGQVVSCLEELLGSFDATGDDILVRRQPGSRLELSGEVVRAKTGDCGYLL